MLRGSSPSARFFRVVPQRGPPRKRCMSGSGKIGRSWVVWGKHREGAGLWECGVGEVCKRICLDGEEKEAEEWLEGVKGERVVSDVFG